MKKKLIQAFLINGREVKYSILSSVILQIKSRSNYIGLDRDKILEIIYRGLESECGLSLDEFKSEYNKGSIYASSYKGHLPKSLAEQRVRQRFNEVR